MQNREQVINAFAAFRQRIKDRQDFREHLKEVIKNDDARRPFSAICKLSLREAYSHAYPAENYNAGKRMYEEDGIDITHFEAAVILLVEPENSVLKKYVGSVYEFNRHPLTRTAAFFGAPTDRRDINARQSLKDLGKNFIGYKDSRFIIWNILFSPFHVAFNLLVMSVKIFVSTIKFVTEYIPYTLHEFFKLLAKKALANVRAEMPRDSKALLYTAYGLAKTLSVLLHVVYFFGRTITSPAKGVIAAAKEGGKLGDRIGGPHSVTGDIVATLFVVTSLALSIFAYLTIFPIKLTISFTTTVPFLGRNLPGFIVKPIAFITDKITPVLTHIGDVLGKFLDPIVAPIANALHEPLTLIEIGLGGFAGVASATAETSYTLFKGKFIRAITVGIVGALVAAGGLIASFIRGKKQEEVKQEVMTLPSSSTNILRSIPVASKTSSPTKEVMPRTCWALLNKSIFALQLEKKFLSSRNFVPLFGTKCPGPITNYTQENIRNGSRPSPG